MVMESEFINIIYILSKSHSFPILSHFFVINVQRDIYRYLYLALEIANYPITDLQHGTVTARPFQSHTKSALP